jgi:large repetitive protein
MKALWLITIFLFSFEAAQAACSSPSGSSGDIRWDATQTSINWCNGTTWVNPIIGPGLSCTTEPQGRITNISSSVQFCDGTFWQIMKGTQMDFCLGDIPGTFRWDSNRMLMKFCDGINWHAMYDAKVPNVASMQINNGDSFTRLNNLRINLSASSTETYSKITHFCFKHSPSGTVPAAPDKNDSCWSAVNLPSPGISPENSISFANFFYSIGFTPATYTLYGWVKNGADLISSLSMSGSGTTGVDKAMINYDPGSPPVILNVFATRSDSSPIPPQPADLVIPAGNDVIIKWKLTDDEILPSNPIEISYTTDEVNFHVIASNLSNSAHSGCSVDGATSTGCYRWANGSPANTYFKIRVQALDDGGLSSIASAEPNNMTPFKIIAGTTDPGLGGSAASAVIFPVTVSPQYTAAGSFVVRDNGTMYIVESRGLMVIDPNDGNYKLFFDYSGTQVDGPYGTAKIAQRPYRIALDYQDRLLIYETGRVRRFNFTTNQLTTIVGGGSSTGNGTAALDYSINQTIHNPPGLIFNPLPNGDIWFQTGSDTHVARDSGAKIRVYKASDMKVYETSLTGIGANGDASYNPGGYGTYNYGIAFNPITSQVTHVRSRSIVPTVGGHSPYGVSYDPATGATTTPHIPYLSYWGDDPTITSRTGEMYSLDRFSNIGMWKYNSSTNSWDRIIGNGQKGQCPDGTPALSCATDMTDAFVTAQNQIFIVDHGLIRTLDSSGNLITIFGQSLIYGDGDLAVNARINDTNYIDLSKDGKIVFVDSTEHVIREFAPDGNIIRVAGNGIDAGADLVTPANAQPVSASYWGAVYSMSVDPTDGTIYFPRQGTYLSKIDRSTGLWVDIAGFGGTSYSTADGLSGNQVWFDGYNQGALGFNGSSVLRHFYRWNGSYGEEFFIKSYDKDTGTQSAFAGIHGAQTVGSIDECGDNTPLASCGVPSNMNVLSKAQWDSANSRWLLAQNGSNRIRTAVEGGNWGTLVALPRGMNSFKYVVKPSGPHVYYCSGARMFKYNITTSTETQLYWPSPTVGCYGLSLVWHPTRQSIIFPIKQNGLGAIAEILDP